MIEHGIESSWAHFEVINECGWFKNLLRGKEPWIEVAYLDQKSLELNPGVAQSKRAMPSIREKWRSEGKKQWIVPITDIEELTAWIDDWLKAASGNPNYRVSGWLDGL